MVSAASNEENAYAQLFTTSPYSFTLFKGSLATAIAANAITNLEQPWDESPSADPNDPGQTSPQGGEFADTDPLGYGNAEIDVPDTIDELDYSGFITLYKCDDNAVQKIGAAIFSTNTWTNLQNKFSGIGDPIQYIISAVEVPYSAPSGTKNFNLGGIEIVNNSGNYVSVATPTKRFNMLNFGSVTLKETWGTEKDYSTTDVAIYLPYVGVKDLDTTIVMNSTITVKAMLDVWTGDLLYMIIVNNKSAAYKYLGSSGIAYRFQGNCGIHVPIGKADNTNQLLTLAGSIASMGVGLAAGGAGLGGYNIDSDFDASRNYGPNVSPKMVGGGAAGLLGGLMMGQKVSLAGGAQGGIGRADYQQPYLILKQSIPVYPANWRSHFGAPRYQEFRLEELHGYVQCADVHAEDIPGANDAERAAIEMALKAGVFVP